MLFPVTSNLPCAIFAADIEMPFTGEAGSRSVAAMIVEVSDSAVDVLKNTAKMPAKLALYSSLKLRFAMTGLRVCSTIGAP